VLPLRCMHHASWYLVGCGGVCSSPQQRQHHGGVPPAGCQVQRTAPILRRPATPAKTSEAVEVQQSAEALVPSCATVQSVMTTLCFVTCTSGPSPGQCFHPFGHLDIAPIDRHGSVEWDACAHLVDAAVDELLLSLQELLYGRQVAGVGSLQKQARPFLLHELQTYNVSDSTRPGGCATRDIGMRAPFALAAPC
jgi:hypothetical protein